MALNATYLKSLLLTIVIMTSLQGVAQTVNAKFGKGVHFTSKDSTLDMKLTFRFQTLMQMQQTMNVQNELQDDFKSNFLIRRSRIKFNGFVYNPTIKYKVELALSNRDVGMGSSTTDAAKFNNASNIVLDAVLKWKFAKNTELWVGQTKLPGNRERVISSQQLQFVDRSLLNSRFNLDRDVGVHIHHKTKLGEKLVIKEIGAITLGEGRNVTAPNDDGFCYTGRFEFLPMGEFTAKGDYAGADVEKEKSPKLAIGLTYDYNDNARRTRGQLSSFVRHDSLIRDLQSIQADFVFKSNGFSMMGEYAKRFIAEGDKWNTYYVGSAYNIQAGYVFKNNFELAGRFTQLRPDKWSLNDDKYIAANKTDQFTIGLSKYIVKHSLKIQSDISTSVNDNDDNNYLMYRFQVEMQF